MTTALLLHGILGRGTNWRSFGRRLRGRRPDLDLRLVDLRYHGTGPRPVGPHTLAACADDLVTRDAEVVIGHSFGGKVALEYARRTRSRQVWLLDSVPGAIHEVPADHELQRILATMRKAPVPFLRRDDFVEWMKGEGYSTGLSRWLAQNLGPSPDGLIWETDIDVVEEMVGAYLHTDLWPFIEDPLRTVEICVVAAGHSMRWTGAEQARARAAGCRIYVLENAGHWLHVDDPEGLLEVLVRHVAR